MKEQIKILKKHILTGTSHMIPFIVAGGILFSISVMLNPAGAATPTEGWLAGLAQIGLGGLTLFVPVLGGYIAYSIADKPGLAPGMIGAYLANSMGAGFLGGMAAGLIAGVVVKPHIAADGVEGLQIDASAPHTVQLEQPSEEQKDRKNGQIIEE